MKQIRNKKIKFIFFPSFFFRGPPSSSAKQRIQKLLLYTAAVYSSIWLTAAVLVLLCCIIWCVLYTFLLLYRRTDMHMILCCTAATAVVLLLHCCTYIIICNVIVFICFCICVWGQSLEFKVCTYDIPDPRFERGERGKKQEGKMKNEQWTILIFIFYIFIFFGGCTAVCSTSIWNLETFHLFKLEFWKF